METVLNNPQLLALIPQDVADSFVAATVVPFVMVFLRVAMAIMLLPGFGELYVPMRVRLVIALAITASIFTRIPLPDPPRDLLDLLLLILTESFIGAFLGVSVRILLSVLHVAGQAIGLSISLSNIFSAGNGFESGSAISGFLVAGGVLLIFVAGLHLEMLGAIFASYQILPVGAAPSPEDFASRTLEIVSASFAEGIRLSMPFLVLSLVFNVGLGIVNRAMPQLSVFFIAMPATVAGGLMMLFFSTLTLMTLFREFFHLNVGSLLAG